MAPHAAFCRFVVTLEIAKIFIDFLEAVKYNGRNGILVRSQPLGAMKEYRSIKELVLELYRRDGLSDYETTSKEIKKYFTKSKWSKSHFAWYRSQIKTGKIKTSGQIKSKAIKSDPEVKRIGDEILKHIKFIVDISARNNQDLKFKLNRWIYSRLLQSEIRAKRPIKKQLWQSGMKICQDCGKKFDGIKNVEIHRKDRLKGYSVENCILVCRECHEKMGQ